MPPSVAFDGYGEKQTRPGKPAVIAAHAVVGANEPLLEVADGPVRQWHCGFRALAQVASQGL